MIFSTSEWIFSKSYRSMRENSPIEEAVLVITGLYLTYTLYTIDTRE